MRACKWLPVAAAALLLAGCNTMEGFGEDVESAGEAIEEEAEESDGD
jgi:predicted small secreted protein